MDGSTAERANGSRKLRDALHGIQLVFEPAPPSRINEDKQIARADEIIRLLRGIDRLDAVNLPELVDENHEGRPYYRSGDIVGFASRISKEIGRDAIVNKVVVHLQSEEDFQRWFSSTKNRGIGNIVLVGGNKRHVQYPGPPVTAANTMARELLRNDGGCMVGNITIPTREDEARRMLDKTMAGAEFFTTQLLFESDSIIKLLKEYHELCKEKGIKPAAVLLSFAPISDDRDIEFIRWLGAEIPEETEEKILQGSASECAGRSIENAVEIWERARSASSEHAIQVPIGIKVEEISKHNLNEAIRMLARFAGILR